MKMCLSESLQPVIEALAPTQFGRPKTQSVISEYLELFEAMRKEGYTYKQIADALNAGGGRGRKGAEFSDRSLGKMIERARTDVGERGPAEIRTRASHTAHEVRTGTTSKWDQDLPNSPEISVFKQRINEVIFDAATDELLFPTMRADVARHAVKR